MPSVDFNLSLKEQIYALPNTELVTKEEKDIILEFKWVQYAVFFRKESLKKFTPNSRYGASHGDIEDIIKHTKLKDLTYQIAVNNLLEEAKDLQSKQLIKRIETLKERIKNKNKLADCKIMTRTDNYLKKFLEYELVVSKVDTYIDTSIPLDMLPVSEVAKKIEINPDTIRQACQDGRIIARKFKSGWSVCVEECKEYWKKNEELNEEQN